MPWRSVDPAIVAPILAMVTAIFRIIYDRQETRLFRALTEAVLCSLLAVGVGAALRAAGVTDPNWQLAAGSLVGLMGVDFVRAAASRVVVRYTGPERRKK